MTHEFSRPPDYHPVRRGSDNSLSPLRRLMALRSEALIDQARIVAEITSEHLNVQGRMNAGFELAEHLTVRAAGLRDLIYRAGDDPELHRLHSYIKAASTEAIIDLIKGDRP